MLNEEHRRAIAVADRALAAAERADLVDIVADALVTRGTALAALGRGYEGGGAIEAGERLAAAHGRHDTVLRAMGNQHRSLHRHRPRAGLDVARAQLELRAPG